MGKYVTYGIHYLPDFLGVKVIFAPLTFRKTFLKKQHVFKHQHNFEESRLFNKFLANASTRSIRHLALKHALHDFDEYATALRQMKRDHSDIVDEETFDIWLLIYVLCGVKIISPTYAIRDYRQMNIFKTLCIK